MKKPFPNRPQNPYYMGEIHRVETVDTLLSIVSMLQTSKLPLF